MRKGPRFQKPVIIFSYISPAVQQKTSAFLQVLKATGGRMGEILRLRWSDVDFVKGTITINNPEKGSYARRFAVDKSVLDSLQSLPHSSERIFPCTRNSIGHTYMMQRNRLALKLGNPRLKQVHLHTFRHFYATMLYAKTQNILKVKEKLGHKSVKNTEIYTHLLGENFNPEYDVATAETDAERKAIIKAGYQFVEQDKVGVSYYRKAKFV